MDIGSVMTASVALGIAVDDTLHLHLPVQPGTFVDRTRHERDRQAKWGSTRGEADNYQRKVNRIEDKDLIPAAEMKLVYFSSENHGNDRQAAYAIDGNPRTVWHSQFSGELARLLVQQ